MTYVTTRVTLCPQLLQLIRPCSLPSASFWPNSTLARWDWWDHRHLTDCHLILNCLAMSCPPFPCSLYLFISLYISLHLFTSLYISLHLFTLCSPCSPCDSRMVLTRLASTLQRFEQLENLMCGAVGQCSLCRGVSEWKQHGEGHWPPFPCMR